MQNSLNKIAYSILENVRRDISDDEFISLRQVKDDIHTLRALFLRNELNKSRSIDPAIVQDLGCVGLEYADPADCCNISTDCLVLRTNRDIPKTIERHHSHTITRVGPVNKTSISFNIIPYERAPYVSFNRFSSREIFAYLLNDRIYLVSSNKVNLLLEKINIRGVFEDPTEAGSFEDCDSKTCYTDDGEYPLNRWMEKSIIDELTNKYLTVSASPKDDKNDANSNIHE